MDKGREMRRGGASKESPGHKLVSALKGGGDADIWERGKKGKIRGWNNIGGGSCWSREDSEMGSGSDGEEVLPSHPTIIRNRKLKLNQKAFDECNAVDPAVVPRKIRSAMSKRNRESISPPLPDLKKQHLASTGTNWHITNGERKSKQKLKLGNLDVKVVLSPITKDEEEVAEALYTLARMFPHDKPIKAKGDRKTAATKSSPVPEAKATLLPPSEVSDSAASKEEIKKLSDHSVDAEGADTALCNKKESLVVVADTALCNKKESLDVVAEVEPEKEINVPKQLNVLGSDKLALESSGTSLDNNHQRTPKLPKNEPAENAQTSACANFTIPVGVTSELYPTKGLSQPTPPEALTKPKEENLPGSVIVAARKQKDAEPLKKTYGSSGLWPGFSARSCDDHGLSNRSLGSKGSAVGPDYATCEARPVSTGDNVSVRKLPVASVERRQSWKVCATHVYISRLIRDYRDLEKKNRQIIPVSANKLGKSEGTKSGIIAPSNEQTGVETGLLNFVSPDINNSPVKKSPHEARFGIQQESGQLQDQQGLTTSSINGHQTQSCDFLSLSPGSGAGSNSTNPGKALEHSAQNPLSYLHSHSLMQHHPRHAIMPFSLPHARYSSPYPDQVTVGPEVQQGQLQLPQYLSNQYCDPHLGRTSPLLKQQQQQLWTAQLAAQYTPLILQSSNPQKWQNGRQYDSPSQSILPAIPPSPALEAIGGVKYSSNSQQVFATIYSSPSYGGKVELHPRSNYEEAGGGFHPDASAHLQHLLCNAQHT